MIYLVYWYIFSVALIGLKIQLLFNVSKTCNKIENSV